LEPQTPLAVLDVVAHICDCCLLMLPDFVSLRLSVAGVAVQYMLWHLHDCQ
jgi:hypothetical protein